MHRIVVLGAGFAGLWSAIGAARALGEFDVGVDRIEIVIVDRTAWHSIRVRNYEADLSATRVSLDAVLEPLGVRRVEAEITGIDTVRREISLGGGAAPLGYDRLVCALGSRLARPPIPGLAEYGFDVDTYEAGMRLNRHVATLAKRASAPGQYTALVVGGGLTGIEAATELPAKIRTGIDQCGATGAPMVILADRQQWIGSDMGDGARPVIAEALAALGIETRVSVSLAKVDPTGATLDSGERIPAATVVWCAGMQAHPLAAQFPVERDRLGRLPVDAYLRVSGMQAEFAAGDIAWLMVDDDHVSVMSCQHGRPMGRFAGHNVVCDLLGRPMLPLRIEWYTTILDLGPWGAVYTEGWDRRVASSGAAAKRTKEMINRERIYPPYAAGRRALLDAAAPVVQAPPRRFD